MKRTAMTLGHAAALLAACAMAVPAQAQFGGLFGSRDRDSQTESKDDCGEKSSRSIGGRILGGILGQVAGNAARRAGVPIFVPVAELTDQLTATIACKLDPEEQKQAADATLQVTRVASDDEVAEIGATAAWTSGTREGVSGRSTVVAREESALDGADCITVSDVIIVSGEETRADKRMCRPEGSARYSVVA